MRDAGLRGVTCLPASRVGHLGLHPTPLLSKMLSRLEGKLGSRQNAATPRQHLELNSLPPSQFPKVLEQLISHGNKQKSVLIIGHF